MKKRKSALNRLLNEDNYSEDLSQPSEFDSEIEHKNEGTDGLTSNPLSKKNDNKKNPLSKIQDLHNENEDSEYDIPESAESDSVSNAETASVEPVVPRTNKRKKRKWKNTPVFSTVMEQETPLEKIVDTGDVDVPLPPKNEDEYEYEETLNVDFLVQAEKEEKLLKRNRFAKRVSIVLLIVGCVYMLFLIYGVFNTEYVYNDNGEIVPQKMTIEQIRTMEQYNEIATQYRISRILYEKVLTLDYRIAAGIEDAKIVAPEYEGILEDIESLSIQIKALDVPIKYTQLKNMLATWVQTDVAVYCQRMSQAISQDNAEYAQQAMQYRTVMYDDFSLITENMVVIGQNVDGVNIEDIINWSPDKFVRDNLGVIQ